VNAELYGLLWLLLRGLTSVCALICLLAGFNWQHAASGAKASLRAFITSGSVASLAQCTHVSFAHNAVCCMPPHVH
jgi:hypothetical protein